MRVFYVHVSMTAALVFGGSGLAHAQTGACCLGDGTCITTDSSGCNSVVGDYVGDSTVCDFAACVAACCFTDNTCTEQTRDDCEALTGTYQGPGSTCQLHCAAPLPPVFTYQGQLKELGRPVNGLIDIQLALWRTAKGGEQVGDTLELFDIAVENGLFSAPATFSPGLFDGNNRWLEVAVRSPSWDGTGVEPGYTTLSPRQLLTSTPHALQTRGLYVDDAGNIAVGHNAPATRLHLRGADDPTIKIQADGDDEIAGRIALRQNNNTGMDMYYDGTSANEALTFQAVHVDTPSTKLMKINRRLLLPSAADRVEIAGRLRLRSVDLDATVPRTNLVIGHALVTSEITRPANMMIDFTKSGGPEPSARIEFNGDADPVSHHGDLRFHTRSVSDTDVVERMRIAEDGKIGMGTTNPTVALDVIGRIRSSGTEGGLLTAVNPSNQAAQVHLSWLNDVARIRIGGSGAGAQGGLDVQTVGDRSLMRILDNGRVGVGTASPQSLLQVGVGDESAIRLGLNPQLVLSRDVANNKFRIQLTGSGYAGNLLQLGRDDGTHDIMLSGEVKVRSNIRSINASGATRVRMGVSTQTNPSNSADHGEIELFDTTGRKIVGVGPSSPIGGEVSGRVTVNGPNSLNVRVGSSSSNVDLGSVAVYGSSGNPRAAIGVTPSDNGEITIRDSSTQIRAGIRINLFGQGEVFGDIKSFRVPNPRDPSTDIWYASLEGPEAGAYYRGTATLRGGRAAITLPEHFSDVCSHTSLTVHLTPRSAGSKGLAFTGVQNGTVIVEELFGGTGNYEFDYMLVDVRAGHEAFEVIRPALRLDDAQASGTDLASPASVNPTSARHTQSTSRIQTDATDTANAAGLTAHDRAPMDAATLVERIERLESILERQIISKERK